MAGESKLERCQYWGVPGLSGRRCGLFLDFRSIVLGAPVALPLIALVASKQQQKLRAEVCAYDLIVLSGPFNLTH